MPRRRSIFGNEGPGQPPTPRSTCNVKNPPRIRRRNGNLCKQPEDDRFGVYLGILQTSNEGRILAGNIEVQTEVKRFILFAFERELAER